MLFLQRLVIQILCSSGVLVSAFFVPMFHRPTKVLSKLQMASGGGSAAQESKQRATIPSVDDPTSVRNVAFVGHSHSGKTALVEWMLFDEQVITKRPGMGGSASVLDSDPTEAARHSSVFSHFVRVPHGSALLEVSDTPWGDFPSDALAALDGADAAVVVISAADGVQPGTLNAYQHCEQAGIKTMIAISKMDRPFLQLDEVLLDIEDKLNAKPVPIQVMMGQGENFKGVQSLFVVDTVTGTLRKNEAAFENGDDAVSLELEEAWTALEEAVAMTDDELLVEYLENSQLEPDQVLTGLRKGVIDGKILPLVYTSAEKDLGVSELMDAMVAVLPNPLEMRKAALDAACQSNIGKCGMVPGVEAGFAARVLHTIIDSFGSLSVLRVISNSKNDDDNSYHSLPNEAVNLRTGEKVKLPSTSASFGLCGKDRLPLADGSHVIPGDVIAVPKLSETVCTNDILTVESAVKEEEAEISIEAEEEFWTPLSREPEKPALMASATVSMLETGNSNGNKKNRGGSGGDDKLFTCLKALAREDLAMHVEQDAASGMLLLHCMNTDHLKVVAGRLDDRYGIKVELGQPPVQYRETLKKAVTNIEGRHKKQSGGSGQFGVCYINMEPLEEGSGVEFESKIKGGVISKPFIGSVEKGVREQLQSGGPLGGYPVTDVKITLIDGKMHSVDSKDIAFQSAGKLAVKAALARGKTKLLQPMEQVTFVIDEKLQGEINAIVSRQEGYVLSLNPVNDNSGNIEIQAVLPTSALPTVSKELRVASAGEGQYSSEFAHYQPVNDVAAHEIVDKVQKEASP